VQIAPGGTSAWVRRKTFNSPDGSAGIIEGLSTHVGLEKKNLSTSKRRVAILCKWDDPR
jgi:hypothetical protein